MTRNLYILNSFKSFKNTLGFIKDNFCSVFNHYLILIPIIVSGTLLTLINLAGQNTFHSFMSKVLISFKVSFSILCDKQDFSQLLSTLTSNQSIDHLNIFVERSLSLFFNLTFIFSLAGVFLASLIRNKKRQNK